MFISLSLFFMLISFPPLSASHAIAASSGNCPITHIKVISERCSGSYYTEALIRDNIEGLHSIGDKFGVKHFYPWFGYESWYYGPKEDFTFAGSDHVLFVILFRDPYDWLRSFKRTTFLGPAELQVCDFSTFIRGKWGINSNYESVKKLQKFHPHVDLKPETGAPFNNVIELRTAKIKNHLELARRVKNYYIVNYERARDYPKEVVQEVAELFNLTMKAKFQPITKIRGNPNAANYVPIKYRPISEQDLRHINLTLDEEVEKSIGYELRSSVN